LTVVGPFVSIVPLILLAGMGPRQLGNVIDLGSTSTVTFVTEALGDSTTGMEVRLPPALTTLAETQHRLPEFCGSTIFHQEPSELLPVICELCPTSNALIATQAVPGPNRQLTFTSFGDAAGTVGVDVGSGGAVLLGKDVNVGASVAKGCVAEGTGEAVGVSVTGRFDGRLQASIDKTSTSAGNKVRGFMVSSSPLI